MPGESQKFNGEDAEGMSERVLPHRDWVLLPMLSLLTIVALLLLFRWIAVKEFPESTPAGYRSVYECVNGVGTNQLSGLGGIARADCWGNMSDTPLTEYRLNGRGHRAGAEYSPKAAGAYRIVMIGSSFAIGEGVPVEETIAPRLADDLQRETGRKVEVYNEGMFGEVPDVIAAHFNDVMPAEPDLVLWLLTPHDIKDTTPGSAKTPPRRVGLAELARNRFSFDGQDQLVVLLRHLLFSGQGQYVKSYLAGAQDAGFLRAGLDAEWLSHLQAFDSDDARIETQARADKVPVATVLLPNRAQAAMISMGEWPQGFDPYKLEEELDSIVASHGGNHIDILHDLRAVPNAERNFFTVNGHPKAEGDAILARLLAKELSGNILSSSTTDRQ